MRSRRYHAHFFSRCEDERAAARRGTRACAMHIVRKAHEKAAKTSSSTSYHQQDIMANGARRRARHERTSEYYTQYHHHHAFTSIRAAANIIISNFKTSGMRREHGGRRHIAQPALNHMPESLNFPYHHFHRQQRHLKSAYANQYNLKNIIIRHSSLQTLYTQHASS